MKKKDSSSLPFLIGLIIIILVLTFYQQKNAPLAEPKLDEVLKQLASNGGFADKEQACGGIFDGRAIWNSEQDTANFCFPDVKESARVIANVINIQGIIANSEFDLSDYDRLFDFAKSAVINCGMEKGRDAKRNCISQYNSFGKDISIDWHDLNKVAYFNFKQRSSIDKDKVNYIKFGIHFPSD